MGSVIIARALIQEGSIIVKKNDLSLARKSFKSDTQLLKIINRYSIEQYVLIPVFQ